MNTNFNNVGSSIENPCQVITANHKWHYLMNPQFKNQVVIKIHETDSPMTKKIKEFMVLYGIIDIKMRMLKIPELKKIMGFPENYVLVGTQADQKKFLGNAVEVTSDINVECPNHNQNMEYAYLAVFHNQLWEPVAWGKRKANQITFKNMGREVVYLPVSYRNRTSYNLTYPFILDNHGGIRYLIPDKSKLNKVHLTGKYPIAEFNARYGEDLVGGYLLCANNKEYNDSILVHRITRNPNMGYEIVNLENSSKYRYWKYVIPGYNRIVELNFFDQEKIVKGKINTLSTCVDYEHLSDGDPLTYFEIHNYIEMDFGKPVNISKIMLLPRNDGNGIYPGDRYELFYFSKNGWTSLGQQVATGPFLDYLNVPDNALLWLRNLSNGVEERIFTWENGVVRFW